MKLFLESFSVVYLLGIAQLQKKKKCFVFVAAVMDAVVAHMIGSEAGLALWEIVVASIATYNSVKGLEGLRFTQRTRLYPTL